MPRGWPPLELRQILAILAALGFTYKNSRCGHDFYVAAKSGRSYKVTVDLRCAPFDAYLLKSMCKQAGCTREEFWFFADLSTAI